VLAAVLEGPRRLFVREVAVPRVEGYALVRSELVGICGTDKAFYVGTYPLFKRPLVPGHEVVGVVVEGPPHLVEKRVVSEIRPPRRPGLPLGRVIGSPHWSGFHPSFGGRSGRPEFPPCRKPGGDPPGNNP